MAGDRHHRRAGPLVRIRGLLVIRTGGVPYLADAADQTALKEVLDSIRLIAQPG